MASNLVYIVSAARTAGGKLKDLVSQWHRAFLPGELGDGVQAICERARIAHVTIVEAL